MSLIIDYASNFEGNQRQCQKQLMGNWFRFSNTDLSCNY